MVFFGKECNPFSVVILWFTLIEIIATFMMKRIKLLFVYGGTILITMIKERVKTETCMRLTKIWKIIFDLNWMRFENWNDQTICIHTMHTSWIRFHTLMSLLLCLLLICALHQVVQYQNKNAFYVVIIAFDFFFFWKWEISFQNSYENCFFSCWFRLKLNLLLTTFTWHRLENELLQRFLFNQRHPVIVSIAKFIQNRILMARHSFHLHEQAIERTHQEHEKIH